MWNEFLSDFNHTCDRDISELKHFLKQWEGPSLDPSYRNYVWTFVGWSIFIWSSWYLGDIFIFIFTHFDYISCEFVFHHESFMYIMTLHCIFFALPQSRILAYWLMLSVVKTTINKVYPILPYPIMLSHQSSSNWTKLNSWLMCCRTSIRHYSDVIMSSIASQIAGVSIVCSPFAQEKKNIQAPCHCFLWWEPPGAGGPLINGQ